MNIFIRGGFVSGNEYCFVSKDLLLFFRWICDNRSDLLEKLIKDAYENGFNDAILQTRTKNIDDKLLQESVVEFFMSLENFIEKESEQNKNSSSCELIIDETPGIALNFDFKNNIIDFDEEEDFLPKQKKVFSSGENLYEALKKNVVEKKINKEAFLSDFLKSWNSKNKVVH